MSKAPAELTLNDTELLFFYPYVLDFVR